MNEKYIMSIELRKYRDTFCYDIMNITKCINENGSWFVCWNGFIDCVPGGMLVGDSWYMRNLDRTIKKMLSHGWVVAEIKTE
jgi:hypothetical protein